MRPLSVIVWLAYHLGKALILVAPALYNRYPLMYFDSGAYMEMAAVFEPSFHRAFGYPMLMNITGLGFTHWPIIIVQGLIISILLERIIIRMCDESHQRWAHFMTIVLLSFGSALSWYAAQLMPDVWTFMLVLGMSALLLERSLNWLKSALYGAFFFFALLTHLSHIPMMFLIVLSLGILLYFGKSIKTIERPKWIIFLGPMILAVLVTCSFNAAHGLGFRLSLASNAFLTANIGEMGYLKLYLDEQCPKDNLNLCDIKDELPRETYGYLWDPNGPIQQHDGGWEGANEAYALVVHDFLTQPRYLKWLLYGSIKSTMQQMFQIELGSGLQYAYGVGSAPHGAMERHYKQELNEYLTSVQNKGDALPINFFRMVNYISILLSLLIIGNAVLMQRLSPELALLLILFLLAYFFNAAITGVLANVYERLQCRLLPLFQLLAILVVLKPLAHFKFSPNA